MSVLIKGIVMPKNCFDCEIFGLCSLRDRLTHIEDRNPDCPLIEIDLVRCGECKYFAGGNECKYHIGNTYYTEPDRFCSYGERRADERL